MDIIVAFYPCSSLCVKDRNADEDAKAGFLPLRVQYLLFKQFLARVPEDGLAYICTRWPTTESTRQPRMAEMKPQASACFTCTVQQRAPQKHA